MNVNDKFINDFQNYLIKLYGKRLAIKTIQYEYAYKKNIEQLKRDKFFYYFIQEKIEKNFKPGNQISHYEILRITKQAVDTYNFETNNFSQEIFLELINYII